MKSKTITLKIPLTPQKEKEKITKFLKETFSKTGITNAVIGLSGGIDSMTSYYLLKETLPLNNIILVHSYYDKHNINTLKSVKNLHSISIKENVDALARLLKIKPDTNINKLRIGNISARLRMVILFDLAKKNNALVVGTENKSENLLGYFTRFGDQASDIEPMTHLYKTQVYQLAAYLKVPESILKQVPTAGLWKNQTDEGEFGFTYQEADLVLYNYYEKHIKIGKLLNHGFKNAEKIIEWSKKNHFKHLVPYKI